MEKTAALLPPWTPLRAAHSPHSPGDESTVRGWAHERRDCKSRPAMPSGYRCNATSVFDSRLQYLGAFLPFGAHFCHGFLDGLLGDAMGHETAAELLDGAVLGPLGFPFGQMDP